MLFLIFNEGYLASSGAELVRTCPLTREPPSRISSTSPAGSGSSGISSTSCRESLISTDPITDWAQILALYGLFGRVDPSPIVKLIRAVTVAEVEGPAMALLLVDGLDLG